MATYQVSISNEVVRVDVRREGDATFVRVNDGDEVSANLAPLHGALYTLTRDDQRLEVAAQREEDGVRVVVRGLEFLAEVEDEAHARLAAVAGSRSQTHARLELKAPMPGLLVRLLVSVGDEVQPSQPLVVLQAMKMENELSLPRGGTVAKVNVAAGQAVEQNQVLVVLE